MPDIAALAERLSKLEKSQKPSVDHLKKSIVQYALRQISDFDKYEALKKIEQLKTISGELKDKKPDFYSSVYATLAERIIRPTSQFKDYVLSLLGDRDYEKIMETVSKIDKNFSEKNPNVSFAHPPHALPFPRHNFISTPPPLQAPTGPPPFPGYNPPPPPLMDRPNRPPFPGPRRPAQFCSLCNMNNHNDNNCFRRRRRFNPY